MPGMKATGTNTDSSTSVMAMIGAVIWAIAALVASAGDISGWALIVCSTASTTTIASSTTMPIAKTSANSEIVLAERASASIAAKTTRSTSTKASIKVVITLWIEALTNTVVS